MRRSVCKYDCLQLQIKPLLHLLPHSFWSPTKPKRNVRRAFVAHQLCLQFENCAKSNAHTTHTNTVYIYTHIYALTNVEIMQVNRLIGSSNGHTLCP